jgi:hypothetical protein
MRAPSFAALWAVVLVSLSLAACQAPSTKDDAAFGDKAPQAHAFEGKIYYLPENAPKLPDFKSLKPQGTIYASQLNVPDQDFALGFPGVTNRTTWFAIDYKGTFRVPSSGRYGFRLSSDDGSKLFIDDKQVIDNDGQHATSSASGDADLSAGAHRIEVQYFQGPPVRVSLQFYCTQPGGKEAIFPGCGLTLSRPHPLQWLMWVIAVLLVAVAVAAYVTRRRWVPPPAPGHSAN